LINERSSNSSRIIKRETLNLYSLELGKGIPSIEPRIPVEFEMCAHPLELVNAEYEVVKERVASGNLIFIARHRSTVVGYLFASTTSCEVGEIEDLLMIHDGEVYFYDAFTLEGFRGNRIYPALLASASHYFKNRDFSFALIFTRASNVHSISGIEKAGFSSYQVVQFMNEFGVKSWNYSPRSYDVKSHFANEDK
jgi:hypothetical protein